MNDIAPRSLFFNSRRQKDQVQNTTSVQMAFPPFHLDPLVGWGDPLTFSTCHFFQPQFLESQVSAQTKFEMFSSIYYAAAGRRWSFSKALFFETFVFHALTLVIYDQRYSTLFTALMSLGGLGSFILHMHTIKSCFFRKGLFRSSDEMPIKNVLKMTPLLTTQQELLETTYEV